MSGRIILMLASLVGMCSTFMPWLHYPSSGMKLYGYVGDGVLTGFVFFTLFILAFFLNKYQKFISIYSLIAGALIFCLGFYNLSEIRDQQLNFKSDNIGITMASAGFYEGVGIYFNMFGGLGLFISGLILLMQKKSNSIKPTENKAFLKYAPHAFGSLVLLVSLFYFLPQRFNVFNSEVPKDLESIIYNDINSMVKALENNDFKTYNKYVHPVLAQSMGGEKLLKEFFEGTYSTFREDKISIKNIAVEKLLDVKTRSSDKQALFIQKVTFSQNGKEFVESQKTLAINDQKSKNWKYITLGNNKKISEIKKMFPAINEQLNNLEN